MLLLEGNILDFSEGGDTMKRLISLLVIIGVISLTLTATAATVNSTGASKHVFGVHGLSCPFCVIGIKKTFKKIAGVRSVEVSMKNNTVTLNTDKGICFTEKESKVIFGKTGFSYHGIISQPKSCQ